MENPKEQPEIKVQEEAAEQQTSEEVKEETAQAAQDEKLAELEAKLKDAQDNYLRLMADFDNFRRHSSNERLKLIGSASADVIKGLLPVLDDIERAIKMIADGGDSAALEGTELIYNKLMGYLKTKGLAIIEAKGAEFSTDLHEAVAKFPVEDEALKGKVFDVAQTGYTLNGEVLRYAKVVVAI